ncbi:MAG: hypothetical protein FWD48_01590 [Oscillospiraceae bacterium]|nr:hypothetical protein [Oscillospiraceae bacterium]
MKKDDFEASSGGAKDITRGTIGVRDGECYFVPLEPYEYIPYKESSAFIRIKCKSLCQGSLLRFCACYNTEECVGHWHLVEKIATGEWIPCNKAQFNHSGRQKWIHGFYPSKK